MAKIKVELGATINQGDFNNIKINVSFEDSVGKGELFDQAFDRIYDFTEEKLQAKIDELDGDTSPKDVKPKKPAKTVKRKRKSVI